jgi:hypothetical protein
LAAIPDDAEVAQRKLAVSVQQGELNATRAVGAVRWMDSGVMGARRRPALVACRLSLTRLLLQIRKLIDAMLTYGLKNAEGKPELDFGVLRIRAGKLFWGQALPGILAAAREKGVLHYDGKQRPCPRPLAVPLLPLLTLVSSRSCAPLGWPTRPQALWPSPITPPRKCPRSRP